MNREDRLKEQFAKAFPDHDELSKSLLSLMNNVPGVVYRGLPDWSITFMGADVERLIGYTAEEFMNDHVCWRDLIHTDDLDMVKRTFRDAVEERKGVLRVEYRIRHKDGSNRTIADRRQLIYDGDGTFKYVDGLLLDITERKRTEDALKVSEEKYRNIFNNAQVGMFRTRISDGKLMYCNGKIAEIFGYDSREEAIDDFIAVDRYVNSRDREHMITELREKGEINNFETQATRCDGSIIWVRYSARIYPENGYVEGILMDIDEEKKAEEALRESEEQLRQSQKMESVGRLAGGIAHDINNYLSAISGYCEVVKMQCMESPEIMGKIDAAIDTVFKASSLIRQLLAFSRKQPAKPRVINLNDVIRSMGNMMKRIIEEDIEIESILSDDLWNVKVDPSQMEQVIVNLLVNARDAMPVGGKITVTTSNEEVDEKFLLTRPEAKKGSYAVISVSDTGTGIDSEIKDKVFEPFFTTKEKGQGSGLGLSTVYGIVKQNDGYIWIDNESERGTTFRVYLPRCDETFDGIVEHTDSEADQGTKNENILLVEDNDAVRESTEILLKTLGYNVLVAPNGKEAFRLFEEQNSDIHLVITDVVMPEMGGKDLISRIMERNRNTKALFISGYLDDTIQKHGVLYKGINFLQKPFTSFEIAKKIREILD
jgi:PAS domain S-box-containing protein